MLATFKETSELLKCNRATLYRLKKEGRLDKYITEVEGVLYLELDGHAREPKLSTYLKLLFNGKVNNHVSTFHLRNILKKKVKNLIGASSKHFI